ncbi:unnamed protein product [Caenorhabditis sp. 36 PRJEB53466]|nr:unnamed protein product [Caenorhabditis sp. 36 PRJEB53466]
MKPVITLTTQFLHIHGLESKTERLLHKTTVCVMIGIACLLMAKPFFGQAITCQVPADWPSSSVDYFHNICYFGNRLNTSFRKVVYRGPKLGTLILNETTGQSAYYMYIPYIVLFQVMLCLVPALFWKFIGLNFFYGRDVETLLEKLTNTDKDADLLEKSDWSDRKMALQVQEWIRVKREHTMGMSRTLACYALMKWLRLALFVWQFNMIADFFADGNRFWGFETTSAIWYGKFVNPLIGEFTLVTGCEVQRLRMSVASKMPKKTKMYTGANSTFAQCILSANFLNSKVFLFLYWWLVLVILVCFCSALEFTLILLCPRYRRFTFKRLIRNEQYYILRCGLPHKNLHLGARGPIDHLIDYLGNDGYLFAQIVFDMLHYQRCNGLIHSIWELIIVHDGEEIPEKECSDKKDSHHEKHERNGRFTAGKNADHSKKLKLKIPNAPMEKIEESDEYEPISPINTDSYTQLLESPTPSNSSKGSEEEPLLSFDRELPEQESQ